LREEGLKSSLQTNVLSLTEEGLKSSLQTNFLSLTEEGLKSSLQTNFFCLTEEGLKSSLQTNFFCLTEEGLKSSLQTKGRGFQPYFLMRPPPRSTSPSYQTAACPGVMLNCGSSKINLTLVPLAFSVPSGVSKGITVTGTGYDR
jgi:hypothetical protein